MLPQAERQAGEIPWVQLEVGVNSFVFSLQDFCGSSLECARFAGRFKGDGTFHPHQSGSKLPHSKEHSGP